MGLPADRKHSYTVMVDDNFHYMDESERYRLAEFGSCAEAIAACRNLIDDYLISAYKSGMEAEQLWASYVTFGEDPFIMTTDEQCKFSAWDYARQRCEALCRPSPTQGSV
jgi:hypothetical protein